MVKLCEFNAPRDRQLASTTEGFEAVLHIFNADWHGIRAAAAYAPGHKLAISEMAGLDGEAIRHIFGIISKYRIKHVIFQGYSHVAADLCDTLYRHFADMLKISAITHVTTAQFENPFEIEMQTRVLDQQSRGIISRLGSVKPNFSHALPSYWPNTILNFAPAIRNFQSNHLTIEGSIFIPIENTWRKNLYTNIFAAQECDLVDTVYSVNFPSGIEKICQLDKFRHTAFKRGPDLFGFMASMEALMNVTLAECQPMTQLEAFAVGTPCLTGPLRVMEFADDPLIRLCEVEEVDNPYYLGKALEKVISIGRQDNSELQDMISAHIEHRNLLAALSYAEFLSL